MIEPLIIMYEDKNWTHPEFQSIVDQMKDKRQPNESCAVWTGPWIRIYLEQEGKTVYIVCTFDTKEEYVEHRGDFYEKFNGNYDEEKTKEMFCDLIMQLEVCLIEDVWMPGGEQFCFSDFGEKLSE